MCFENGGIGNHTGRLAFLWGRASIPNPPQFRVILVGKNIVEGKTYWQITEEKKSTFIAAVSCWIIGGGILIFAFGFGKVEFEIFSLFGRVIIAVVGVVFVVAPNSLPEDWRTIHKRRMKFVGTSTTEIED
jgi:peptidoglycan/LPS O-acetylase OafA/YrhL